MTILHDLARGALALLCAVFALAGPSAATAEAGAEATLDPIEGARSSGSAKPNDATFPREAGTLDFVSTKFEEIRVAKGERPPLIPTTHFASRSALRAFQISPDGRHLAIKRVVEGKNELLLLDAATQTPLKLFRIGDEQRVDWMRWAGNDKLLLSISSVGEFFGMEVRVNRLFVRNVVTNETFMLEVDKQILWGGELVHLDPEGEFALVSVQESLTRPPAVFRYELRADGRPERIVKAKTGVWDWHADDAGVVRLGMGWRHKRLRIYYRENGEKDFDLVGKLKADDEEQRYWSVVQIVSGSDRGYVLEEGANGRVGVRLFDYRTGEVVDTYWEHPDWDVNELWLERDGSPLAALYTDDRDRIEWFDEDNAKLYADLRRALKAEDLYILSRSRGDERMLVWAGSEADPGALYIFSPGERNVALLDNYRPELDFRALARPQPVRYRARDGLAIAAYLTLPRGVEPRNLPLVIMPHGGPFGVRDKLEYNDEVQLLVNRGYAVLQPNYRGSGGYGDAFYEAGTGEIGRRMQDDIDDAMDWAVSGGIADPGRVCVVGGSYGGYAALWAVLRNPERYVCAASWAGVTDWDRMLSYDRRYLTRKASRAWRARVEGDDDFDLDAVSPVSRAGQLSRPVLLAHGTADDNVPVSQFHAFRRASEEAPVRPALLVIEDEGHSFSKAANEQAWYDALIAFLAEHNPADAPGAPSPRAASAP